MFSLVIVILVVSVPRFSSAAESAPLFQNKTSRVAGKVAVAGDVQHPRHLKVFKNREFCGSTVPNETFLTSRDGGLRNAVVMLRRLDRPTTAQPERIVLDNKRCAFVPHIQVAILGSELVLKNSDPILHTVHARMGKETLFNVGLPRWREVGKTLGRTGVMRIDCDVLHTWMSAVIIVTTVPYHSVTDEYGRFVLDGLPGGEYEVEVWHERLGSKRTHLSLIENATVFLDVVYGLK
jgi:hypothetical protein